LTQISGKQGTKSAENNEAQREKMHLSKFARKLIGALAEKSKKYFEACKIAFLVQN
jgi:hypothetical protein